MTPRALPISRHCGSRPKERKPWTSIQRSRGGIQPLLFGEPLLYAVIEPLARFLEILHTVESLSEHARRRAIGEFFKQLTKGGNERCHLMRLTSCVKGCQVRLGPGYMGASPVPKPHEDCGSQASAADVRSGARLARCE